MLDYLLNGDSLIGIELHHPVNQVQTLIISVRNQLSPIAFLYLTHQLEYLLPCCQLQVLNLFFTWRTSPCQYLLELVDSGSPREQRLSFLHFCQHAAHAPDIDGPRVFARSQQNLRSSIPPGGNVLGEDILRIFWPIIEGPNQPEVTQFGLAALINEYVGRLDVPVNQPCRMQEKECLGDLIENVFSMSLSQDILPDEGKEVDIHVFEHKIDISVVLRLNHLLQFDDVRVRELHQKHDLSVGSLRVSRVIESIEVFFQGLDFFCFFVCYLPDMAICPASDLLVDIEPREEVSLDFFTHEYIFILKSYFRAKQREFYQACWTEEKLKTSIDFTIGEFYKKQYMLNIFVPYAYRNNFKATQQQNNNSSTHLFKLTEITRGSSERFSLLRLN